MSQVRIRVEIDQAALNRVKKEAAQKSAERAARVTQRRVQSNIRAAGRVDTGALVSSIKVQEVRADANGASFQVGSDLDYASFQEEGIGPVHARPGGVLRFKPKGSAVFIFRPRTRGFRGAHFFRRAIQALTSRDFV